MLIYIGHNGWSCHLKNTRAKFGEVSFDKLLRVDDRPYKVFIMTPLLFSCSSLFLLLRGVILAPLQGLLVSLFMFTGIPLYYTFIVGWKHIPGLRKFLN